MTEVRAAVPGKTRICPPAPARARPPSPRPPPSQFWVSQSNKWCDVCKVWLKDSAQSWAVHERGMKHKENVARSECRRRSLLPPAAACPPCLCLLSAVYGDAAACVHA